jgi:hypothetical protein
MTALPRLETTKVRVIWLLKSVTKRQEANKPRPLLACMSHLVLFTRTSAKTKMERNSWSSLANLSASVVAVEQAPPKDWQMIWGAVLGNMRLHIIQRHEEKIGHVVCWRLSSCAICSEKICQPVTDDIALANWNLLSLPVACIQIYARLFQVKKLTPNLGIYGHYGVVSEKLISLFQIAWDKR